MRGNVAITIAIAVVGTTGCGRFGFDVQNGDRDAAPADAGPDADPSTYVISSTQLVPASGLSFVDLEVDWTRSLAYIGTREPGHCFEVVDFAVDPPAFVQRRGPPDTTGAVCLGVHLFNDDVLGVTIETSNIFELWQLGVNPRLGNYTAIGSVPVTRPRRIATDVADPFRLYIARGSAAPGFEVVTVSTSPPVTIVAGPSFDTSPCPDSHNEVVDLGSGLVASGCSTDLSPVEMVNDETMALAGSIPASPPTAGVSGFWSAARNADGGIAVVLGWVSAVIQSSVTTPGYALRARFDNDNAYRGATWGQAGTRDVYAARNDGSLELLSLSDLGTPRVTRHAPLGAMGEPYDVAIEPDGPRAIVITNHGTFLVVDTTKLPAADIVWPEF